MTSRWSVAAVSHRGYTQTAQCLILPSPRPQFVRWQGTQAYPDAFGAILRPLKLTSHVMMSFLIPSRANSEPCATAAATRSLARSRSGI